MKCFITTSLKEYQDDVFKIFKEANISVYSSAEITGINEGPSPDLSQDWFASGGEKFESVLIFSFTTDDNAKLAKEMIKKYNEQHKTGYPLRAFIVPVEECIC